MKYDICQDCLPDGEIILRGQIVTKGHVPLVACEKCGAVVEGSPKLWHSFYRAFLGNWPWQDGPGPGYRR